MVSYKNFTRSGVAALYAIVIFATCLPQGACHGAINSAPHTTVARSSTMDFSSGLKLAGAICGIALAGLKLYQLKNTATMALDDHSGAMHQAPHSKILIINCSHHVACNIVDIQSEYVYYHLQHHAALKLAGAATLVEGYNEHHSAINTIDLQRTPRSSTWWKVLSYLILPA